jgi:hypothetical protein
MQDRKGRLGTARPKPEAQVDRDVDDGRERGASSSRLVAAALRGGDAGNDACGSVGEQAACTSPAGVAVVVS